LAHSRFQDNNGGLCRQNSTQSASFRPDSTIPVGQHFSAPSKICSLAAAGSLASDSRRQLSKGTLMSVINNHTRASDAAGET
jgi:hypothetical protein